MQDVRSSGDLFSWEAVLFSCPIMQKQAFLFWTLRVFQEIQAIFGGAQGSLECPVIILKAIYCLPTPHRYAPRRFLLSLKCNVYTIGIPRDSVLVRIALIHHTLLNLSVLPEISSSREDFFRANSWRQAYDVHQLPLKYSYVFQVCEVRVAGCCDDGRGGRG